MQLTDIGRDIPPLTSEELERVLQWEKIRNAFLKKWRDLDFSHFNDQQLVANLKKARNSINKNLTPDDLAGVIKERRGEQILDVNGIPYNHLRENVQAKESIRNAIKSLKSQMSKNPSEYSEYEKLLKDLSKLKDEADKTITN